MGLDNGIIIKTKGKRRVPSLFFREEWFLDDVYQICYWRKCFGVRRKILSALSANDKDNLDIPLSISDIDSIIEIVTFFQNKKNWEEYSESIWEWDEYRKDIESNHLKALKQLKKFMKRHPDDVESVYFYDSY